MTGLSAWAAYLEELLSYVARHDRTPLTTEGVLGSWVGRQRHLYRAGRLTPEQVSLLEEVPGWAWRKRGGTAALTTEEWRQDHAEALAELAVFYQSHGHLLVPGLFVTPSGFRLGQWVAARRRDYRRGSLLKAAVDVLGGLPGWAWSVQTGRAAQVVRRSLEAAPGQPVGQWRLITRREAADLLGYSVTSLATVMSRYPQRWPQPVAVLRVGRVWQQLYDYDQMQAAAGTDDTRVGKRATITDPDGILTCLECGRRFRALGRHLHHAHDLSPEEYRARHRLPASGALLADAQRAEARARMQTEDTSHLDPYRTGERLAEMSSAGVAANRDSRDFELVRAHRLPGQRHAVQAMAEQRRDAVDETARAAGFDGIEDAIRQTRALGEALLNARKAPDLG